MQCHRHPGRVARRRCFRCKQPICRECQFLKCHHIFCGRRCLAYHLLSERASLARALLVDTSILLFQCGRKASHPLLLSILAIEVLVVLAISREARHLPRAPVVVSPGGGMARRLPLPRISSPKGLETVFPEHIELRGETPGASMVALYANARLEGVSVCRGGAFSFPKVRVEKGWNTFNVKGLDGRGGVSRPCSVAIFHRIWAGDFLRGDASLKKMALTFDGGFHGNLTQEIMDILKEKGVRCTIFLTGQYLSRYPELVKRMVKDGHEIGNHTDTHPRLTTFSQDRSQRTLRGVTRSMVQRELQAAATRFHEITGRRMAPFWRAPYGEHNVQIRGWAEEVGYRHISWTTGDSWEDCMDTLDWVADRGSHLYHTSEEIVEKILSFGGGNAGGKNGAIILMHLGSEREEDFPYKKLPVVIDSLRTEGYELVTISELTGTERLLAGR